MNALRAEYLLNLNKIPRIYAYRNLQIVHQPPGIVRRKVEKKTSLGSP